MEYIIVFLEGIITFISPCLLPMLPVYLSYFAGGSSDSPRSVLKNAFGFIIGFTLVFVALGAFAGTVGRFFNEHRILINLVTGMIVILFGLNFLGIIRIGFLNKSIGRESKSRQLGFFSSILFGSVFSISWTPCVSAFLGSALMLAAQSGSIGKGVSMLFLYSLGLGIPFILSAALVGKLAGAFDAIKRNYDLVNRISGLFLIVIGILMASGLLGSFLSLLTF